MNYLMSPNGATFNKPVNISFYCGGKQVPEGFSEEQLILLTLDSENNQWITIPNTKVNIELHSITVSVSSYSILRHRCSQSLTSILKCTYNHMTCKSR
jgi:hypothetical protein